MGKQKNKVKKIIEKAYSNVVDLFSFLYLWNKQFLDIQQQDDELSYKIFLHETLVAFDHEQPSFLGENCLSCKKKLRDLIVTIVNLLAIKEAGQNVLNLEENSKPGSCVILASHPSSHLLTKSWRTLHFRIGDEALQELIMKYSIFIKVENNYIQVAGKPIIQILKRGAEKNNSKKSKLSKETVKFLPPPDSEPHRKRRRRKTVIHTADLCCSSVGFSYYIVVERANMFYAKDLREKFPKSNPLAKGKTASVEDVWNDISRVQVHKEGIQIFSVNLPNILRDILLQLIKNHSRRCHHWRYQVNCHCSATSEVENTMYSQMPINQLLKLTTPCHKVFLFVRRILMQVVPSQLWGSHHNQNHFFKEFESLLKMSRFERFFLGHLMNKVKISRNKWFDDDFCLPSRECLSAKVYLWLLHYGMTLVKAYFYVTESSGQKHQMTFYRKCVWKVILKKSVKEHVDDGQYEELPQKIVAQIIQKKKTLGVSSLRVVPKTETTRLIVNMGSTRCSGIDKYSINQQLKQVHLVLKYIVNVKPSLIGCGIQAGYSCKKITEYFNSIENGRQLYFVKADIQKCYDSMDITRLLNILEMILSEFSDDTFVTRKMAAITARKNRKPCTMYYQQAQPYMHLSTFRELVKQRNIRNSVLVDLMTVSHRTVDSLMNIIKLHLLVNIVRSDGAYFLQRKGISQGSILSGILCNLYYGDMEKSWVKCCADEILARQVDDYLYITPYLDHAQVFLEKMLQGIPDYNLVINQTKTISNVTDINTKLDYDKDVKIDLDVVFIDL